MNNQDTDGDGLGDLCGDLDDDGDGLVSSEDLDRIEACKGYRADFERPGFERGLDDELEEPDDRTLEERERDQEPEAFHAARWDCEHADLDGSGTVTGGDLAMARHLAKQGVNRDKVALCHRRRTISVGLAAVPAHVDHGDSVEACP